MRFVCHITCMGIKSQVKPVIFICVVNANILHKTNYLQYNTILINVGSTSLCYDNCVYHVTFRTTLGKDKT
jgi:hypothetical protein